MAHAFDHQQLRARDRGRGVLAGVRAAPADRRCRGSPASAPSRGQAFLAAAGGEHGAKLPADAVRVEAALVGARGARGSCASSCGKRPDAQNFPGLGEAAKYSSFVVGGGAISTAAASRVGGGTFGLPVVDMIEVSERTRFGNDSAISCAIMPPIDAPTTCADAMPSASIRPMVSSAMSRQLVGRVRPGSVRTAVSGVSIGVSACRRSACVDWPMSRLSKRMTRKPRCGELLAELVVPMDHLRAEPHDQQQRFGVWRRRRCRSRCRCRWRGRSVAADGRAVTGVFPRVVSS